MKRAHACTYSPGSFFTSPVSLPSYDAPPSIMCRWLVERGHMKVRLNICSILSLSPGLHPTVRGPCPMHARHLAILATFEGPLSSKVAGPDENGRGRLANSAGTCTPSSGLYPESRKAVCTGPITRTCHCSMPSVLAVEAQRRSARGQSAQQAAHSREPSGPSTQWRSTRWPSRRPKTPGRQARRRPCGEIWPRLNTRAAIRPPEGELTERANTRLRTQRQAGPHTYIRARAHTHTNTHTHLRPFCGPRCTEHLGKKRRRNKKTRSAREKDRWGDARAGRMLVAILDNYGSVKIPAVLQKYMGGRCVYAHALAAICHRYRFRG